MRADFSCRRRANTILSVDSDDCRTTEGLENLIYRAWEDQRISFIVPEQHSEQNLQKAVRNFILPRLALDPLVFQLDFGTGACRTMCDDVIHNIMQMDGVDFYKKDQRNGLWFVYFSDENSRNAALESSTWLQPGTQCVFRRRQRFIRFSHLKYLFEQCTGNNSDKLPSEIKAYLDQRVDDRPTLRSFLVAAGVQKNEKVCAVASLLLNTTSSDLSATDVLANSSAEIQLVRWPGGESGECSKRRSEEALELWQSIDELVGPCLKQLHINIDWWHQIGNFLKDAQQVGCDIAARRCDLLAARLRSFTRSKGILAQAAADAAKAAEMAAAKTVEAAKATEAAAKQIAEKMATLGQDAEMAKDAPVFELSPTEGVQELCDEVINKIAATVEKIAEALMGDVLVAMSMHRCSRDFLQAFDLLLETQSAPGNQNTFVCVSVTLNYESSYPSKSLVESARHRDLLAALLLCAADRFDAIQPEHIGLASYQTIEANTDQSDATPVAYAEIFIGIQDLGTEFISQLREFGKCEKNVVLQTFEQMVQDSESVRWASKFLDKAPGFWVHQGWRNTSTYRNHLHLKIQVSSGHLIDLCNS